METHIGARIADIRETQGMTQAALAKAIGTTQSAIARIESGKQNVSADMLKKLSGALKKNLIILSPGTMNLAIEGGKKLTGTIVTNTSKNGAVGLLCASLLNHGKTTLKKMLLHMQKKIPKYVFSINPTKDYLLLAIKVFVKLKETTYNFWIQMTPLKRIN